jgi:hypothetical protein
VNDYGPRGNGPAQRDRSDYFKSYFSDPDNRARNTEAQKRAQGRAKELWKEKQKRVFPELYEAAQKRDV